MLSQFQAPRSPLLAIFILMSGTGFIATLIGIRLERAGLPTLWIGSISALYFAGLAIGALTATGILAKIGHIRAFAAFVALLSASTLGYGLLDYPMVWGALRLIDGICVAGVFVCLESWLNAQATSGNRGALLAAYMVALYSGQSIGQILLGMTWAAPTTPFQIASLLISLAIIPVCLTGRAPALTEKAGTTSIRSLFASSPLGTFGAFATGMMLGAFYGLAAVHWRRLGLDLAQIAQLMMIVILGGVVLQWPLGKLSDLFDRRLVIIASFAATAITSFLLAWESLEGVSLMLCAASFGGLGFALYPLCVAHCNDRLLNNDRAAAAGRLVLLYAMGAAIGPLGAATAMTLDGRSGLFLFMSAAAVAAVVVGVIRQAVAPAVPRDDQQDFQIIPRTTLSASTLQARPPRMRSDKGRGS